MRRARWWPLCPLLFLLCFFVPGILSSRFVTLKSIKIFHIHSFLPLKPSIYFSCKGEKSVNLPDVTGINSLYIFNGDESWQPLTELPSERCKRCGLYQKNPLESASFDEWELCAEEFVNGQNVHFKKNEFNATFSCPDCAPSNSSKISGSKSKDANGKRGHSAVVVVTCTMMSVILVAGLVGGYKYWRKRKREEEQARFLKILEESDDMEDELGLGRII